MVDLKKNKESLYSNIIRNNSRTVKHLKLDGLFPNISLEVFISPITINDYANLVEWSGETNAQYLTSCVHNFYKNWILFENQVEPNSSYNKENKKDKLILDITDCLEPYRIDIQPLCFFKSLQERPFHESIEFIGWMRDYGQLQIDLKKINNDSKNYLELSVLGNWIAVRPYDKREIFASQK